MVHGERDKLIISGVKQIKFALAKVAGSAPASIEHSDLISEGLLCVMRSLDTWEPDHASGAKFSTYVFPKIKGAMLEYVEKQRLTNFRYTAVAPEVECSFGDNGAEALENSISAELRSLNFDCLTRKGKILLELHFMRGQSQLEIASRTNIQPSTICVNVWKAINTVRERNNIPLTGTWQKSTNGNGHK